MTVAAWTRLGRAWLGTLGRAALARAVPAWAGALIVGAAVFGGNGLRPVHLAAIAATSPAVIAVAAVGWLVLLAPAIAAMTAAPGARYLRTLPGAAVARPAAPLAIAFVVHAPWGGLAIATAPVGGGLTWLGLALASLALAAALARLTPAPRRPRWRGPRAALVGAHLRAIARRRGGSVAFAAGLALLGGALGAAMIDGEPAGAATLAILPAACAAAVTACALAAIASAVVDDRRALGPWLAAAASRPTSATTAAALVIAGAGLACAAAVAAVVVTLAAPSASAGATIVGACGAAGLGVGLAMTGVAERARGARRPGQAVAAGAGAVALLAVLAIGLWAARGLGVVVGLGAAAAVGGGRR